MSLQIQPLWMRLMLAVLSATSLRLVDSSYVGSGEGDCDELLGSGCSHETDYGNCSDPSICGKGATQGNLPLAFGLTIGAGLSTTIGALLPCIPLVKRSNKYFLSAALATAGGVMLYVSFTEIFAKAQDYLCCATSSHYYLLATLNLFFGISLTVLLDILLKLLQRIQCKSVRRRLKSVRSRIRTYNDTCSQQGCSKLNSDLSLRTVNPLGCQRALSDNWEPSNENNFIENAGVDENGDIVHVCITSGSTSSSSPDEQNENGLTTANAVSVNTTSKEQDDLSVAISQQLDTSFPESSSQQERKHGSTSDQSVTEDAMKEVEEVEEVVATLGVNSTHLQQMGLLTALALSLHNFPEGLATFIAALSNPSLGITLAIAIALHNIPEGMCVSMPVYYATGSRVKAFLWAFLSGISEPIGALLGWLVLNDALEDHGPVVYGVAFGLIAGLMIYISLKELIPTAHHFDSTGGVIVTIFLVVGMVIMALSLVLFEYT